MTLHKVPSRVPLAVLLVLPGAVASALVALGTGPASLVVLLSALASGALGVLLGQDLRQAGVRPGRCGREVVRLGDRVRAGARRTALLEHLLDARSAGTEASYERTAALLSELVGAEERTRSYLAAELHDTVAQSLSQALKELRADLPQLAVDSVQEAETELRDVLARLRPPELADGDLAQAVADLCRDLHQRYGVAVAVRWPRASVPLSGPVATTVYRFVQETLLNAAVHADGADVRLDVVVDGDVLVTSVSDGGGGFDPDAVRSVVGRHVGLELARERARLAGGSLEVESELGCGTTVHLRLPLDRRRQGAALAEVAAG